MAVPDPPDGPFLARFSGFADLYDRHRPTAPARLGPLLARYAGAPRPGGRRSRQRDRAVVTVGGRLGRARHRHRAQRRHAGGGGRARHAGCRAPGRHRRRDRSRRRLRRRRDRRPGDALDGTGVDPRRGGPHPAPGRRLRHHRRRLAAGDRAGGGRGGVGPTARPHPRVRGPLGGGRDRRRAAPADRRRRSRTGRRGPPRSPPQPGHARRALVAQARAPRQHRAQRVVRLRPRAGVRRGDRRRVGAVRRPPPQPGELPGPRQGRAVRRRPRRAGVRARGGRCVRTPSAAAVGMSFCWRVRLGRRRR